MTCIQHYLLGQVDELPMQVPSTASSCTVVLRTAYSCKMVATAYSCRWLTACTVVDAGEPGLVPADAVRAQGRRDIRAR